MGADGTQGQADTEGSDIPLSVPSSSTSEFSTTSDGDSAVNVENEAVHMGRRGGSSLVIL